jgi:phosphoribosylglycinamide formyltransferase-1
MKRIVILISGRGSNMQAIVQACATEGWPAEVAAVISNRPDAAGLDWAAARGIPTVALDHHRFTDRATFDAELAAAIDAVGEGAGADLVVLAGYMRILGEPFVRRYAGRLVNIHPSLLPAFAGLKTHQRALDAGCKFAGATVHFVTPELDHGPIICQAVVPVLADDSAERLADRVLLAEHQIYPRAVRWWVEGRLRLDGEQVTQIDGLPQGWVMPG